MYNPSEMSLKITITETVNLSQRVVRPKFSWCRGEKTYFLAYLSRYQNFDELTQKHTIFCHLEVVS